MPPATENSNPYQDKLKADARRGLSAGLLGVLYSVGLIIVSTINATGVINFGLPLYVLLALPVTLMIWFVGEIFDRFYFLGQTLTLTLICWLTYYLWTYPV